MSQAPPPRLSRSDAAIVFLAFAFTYFFSALLRAVTATLAPVFASELGIGAAELGLLAGAYFLGFAITQLPLGQALDRTGPKAVLLALLGLAALGCGAFAMARGLTSLVLARTLIGIGVSACLMGPLTFFRHRFSSPAQLRANSWMLMSGSLGMVASTLPVQWLLPSLGWRGLFWGLAASLLLCMALIAWLIPGGTDAPRPTGTRDAGYGDILRHPLFVRLAPMGFVYYGGMVAIQALWAGPWLTRVVGWTAAEAAAGLFGINVSMLVAFMAWGALMPRLVARGLNPVGVISWGAPVPMAILAVILWQGNEAGAAAWAVWCVSCTFVTLSQPAVGQAFPAHQAGRALSAFNLVVFVGVFALQWGIGAAIDLAMQNGQSTLGAYRIAFALLGAALVLSYLWFLRGSRRPLDNAD